jgi:membrane-associated phospholipid phosphatase
VSGETARAATSRRCPDRATPLGRALCAIDDAGERWAVSLRGRRWVDVSAAILSNLADHGAVWVLAAAWKARRPGPERRRAVVALLLAGATSYGVNRAVKQVVERSRPEHAEPPTSRLPVRTPSSSSFPSGHTLAAFCTAVVLPDRRAARLAALFFAAAVAASRIHLRAHHASDVLGGAVIGAALGTLVRPLLGVLGAQPRCGRGRPE